MIEYGMDQVKQAIIKSAKKQSWLRERERKRKL